MPTTQTRNHRIPDLAEVFFRLVGGSVILILLGILLLLVTNAIPFFAGEHTVDFFFSERWNPSSSQPGYGILSLVAGTLLTTLGAMVLAIPLGILTALWLTEIAAVVSQWIAARILRRFSVVMDFGISSPAWRAQRAPNGLNVSGSVSGDHGLPTITHDGRRTRSVLRPGEALLARASRWETMIRIIPPPAWACISCRLPATAKP